MAHNVDKCTDEDCPTCNRIIQFYQEMQDAIVASAPPPITYKRWLPGDPDLT